MNGISDGVAHASPAQVTTSKRHTGSGISSYSPLSTLARQYEGHCLLLFVKASSSCCLEGGVEYILKNKKASLSTTTAEDTNRPRLNSAGSTTSASSTASDPFSFLGEEEAAPAAATTTTGQPKKGLGRFLKQVAKTTSAQLERQVQNLAIRADGGKNPDLLAVGVYLPDNTLYSLTESKPLPVEAPRGLSFQIPLRVPTAGSISLKLWIRSGAALLGKSAKNYPLGQSSILQVDQLRAALANKKVASLNISLQSDWVLDGQLQLAVRPDVKFPPLAGRGWSLCDPSQACYTPSSLFHLPLHQAYVFGDNMGVERTTESTVVLPIATAWARLAAPAAQISLQHAQAVSAAIARHRHDSAAGEYALCQVQIMGGLQVVSQQTTPPSATLSVTWQRPDSIFETELGGAVRLPTTVADKDTAVHSVSFFPKPCRVGVLPAVMKVTPRPAAGFYLGSLRLQISVPTKIAALVAENPFEPTAAALANASAHEVWDCIVSLDVLDATQHNIPLQYPVWTATGDHVGHMTLVVSVGMEQQPQPQNPPLPAAGGLVSLVGLHQQSDMVLPALDFDPIASYAGDPDRERRRQQLATMGYFCTPGYMEQHLTSVRAPDVLNWQERSLRYRAALQTAMDQTSTEQPAAHEDKTPKPFRPSSSRNELLLAGIPFNVHTASLSLDPLMDSSATSKGAVFYNMTCGAPADHARGFASVFPKKEQAAASGGLNSPVGPVSGGLRRLEAKRLEIAALIENLQTTLTMSIANYFVEKRQINRSTQQATHVPPRHNELADLRWKLFEAVQSWHHVTWICAMRRSVAFSQALGIATSSYLASLSDPVKCWQWPAQWAQNGYLVSFEGLLSAAGKELGMIEDASVGIAMLSMVNVVIVSDNGSTAACESSVPVPKSPYLKWIKLIPSGANPKVEYTLQIGMVNSYYERRIPDALKNGTPVRLYPLLFEVGVDIRQWGAHAGSNMKTQIQSNLQNNATNPEKATSPTVGGGLLDDEDDDVGVTDDDVLVQLNSQAFQKLNAYAHALSPVTTGEKTHPMLATLYQHIVSSAGKINHDIVDEAATLAQQLGGGGVVFCKSGKDRTAMHVTYKQAQFANRQDKNSEPESVPENTTLADATLMRVYGTRLPICEKNVGQAK